MPEKFNPAPFDQHADAKKVGKGWRKVFLLLILQATLRQTIKKLSERLGSSCT